MKYNIVKNENSYSKIFGASIVAFFMTMTAISIVAIGNGPGTPPEQTIELGDPKMEDVYNLGGDMLNLTGSNTPVWINSSDTDGDGADYIEYTLFWSDKDPLQHGWNNMGTFKVEDNKEGDEDERWDYISVNLTFDTSCFHEIHAECYNNKSQGTTDKLDFLVDADAPSNLDFDYKGPVYIKDNVRYINCRTIKRINASDTGCVAGVAGVNRIEWEVERWIGNTLVEEDRGIVFDNQDNGKETDFLKITGDNDKEWGRISMNVQLKKNCTHYIYHRAFDNLTNAEDGKKEINRVDVDPPITNKTHPEGHGFIEIDEDESFIKSNMPITLKAEDRPNKDPWKICASGLEAMFWRYEFDGHSYPEEGDPHGYGFKIQTGDELAKTYGYTNPDIIGNDWFRIDDDDTVEIRFYEECRHDLFYWSKDNVWKNEDIHHQIYYVDDTPPVIELINPDTHGFVEINKDEGYIKPFIEVKLVAEDLGKCKSGVESIFWRYEFDTKSYPGAGAQHPFPVVSGEYLQAMYDYNEDWIKKYDWYKIDAEEAIVWFEEQCVHKLFYWTKDNLSNHGDLYDFTYHVDDTPPELQKDHPVHGYYDPENYLFLHSSFPPLEPVTQPVGWWHELYPEFCNEIEVTSWHDTGPIWHGGKVLLLYENHTTLDGWVQYDYSYWSIWKKLRDNFLANGWTVGYATHVTPAELSKYDALFVLTPEHNIPNYEALAIINWVKAGGQLLITQNDGYNYANEITSSFGITFETDGSSWPMDDFAADKLTKIPNNLALVTGTTVQDITVTGDAREIGWNKTTGDCLMAINERAGKGIVIAIGDECMWCGDHMPLDDNKELMDNVLKKFWVHSIMQLSPCDNVDITFEDDSVIWYHVEEVTITLMLNIFGSKDDIYVEFMDGFKYKDEAMFNPAGTAWFEIYPTVSNIYNVIGWDDDGNGYLSVDDILSFEEEFRAKIVDIGIDIILKEEPYLKACSQIDLTAFDDHDCASGVESIFWRYEYGCGDFPRNEDTHGFKIVTGAEMQELYNYWEPEIIEHDWYVYDRGAGIHFLEGCLHKLFYFAKDNVCNHGPIHLQKYHVDNETPEVWWEPPQDGYLYDDINDKHFVKCCTSIPIYATDDKKCDAGVEAIFFRFENETGKYPKDGDPYHQQYEIVTGEELAFIYGEDYKIPEIFDHTWYRINGDFAEVHFFDNCTHDLFYFAKDNVCHHSDVKKQRFYVDCAPPESKKTIGEPKWWDEDEGLWWVTGDTPFSISAEDKIVPCAVGVDYLEVTVYHSCFNGSYSEVGYKIIYDNDGNDEDLTWGIIVYNFILSDFDWRECWYKIVWRAVDKLGNGEEHAHIQYHKRDDTPPHAIILKPTDGWYCDGSAIPSVVLSEDISGVHNGCDIFDDCAVGIEDGSTADAYLLDIFPAIKKVWLDTTNFKYNASAHEYIGNMVIPDPSGIPDGVVLLVVLPEDRLGNNWTTLEEAIHAALMQLLVDCMTENCVIEGLMDLLADFIIDQNIVFLGIDNTPPEVEIIEPENGDDVGIGPIDMIVEAVDVLSGINLGTQMHVTLADINIGALLYNNATDQWEGSLSIPMEVPGGQHELTASIADIAGCIGSDTINVIVADRPGPTTSGTDVQPDPSMITIEGEGEDLTITATVHSTIDFVAGAEYFINDIKPDESEWGDGTSLDPVDGDWGETMEDVTGMFNTDDWDPGTYICWVHGIDESGRWGAFDEEEFSIVLETHWRPIFVRIIEPDDDDGYDTIEVEPCDDKYVHVIVDAHYWDDPFYNELEGIEVSIWLDDPYGAPDQFYNVYSEGNYFAADIPVHWYSSGSTLNVWAKAEDEYFNKEYDDSKFDVITTVEFDLWLEEGWNGPINLAVLGCSDATLDVLASIEPYWDFIFEVGTWDNYWYNQEDEWMNGGTLGNIDIEGWYWIHMMESARFFIDINPPEVEVLYPDEEVFWNDQCLDTFEGMACDLETGIKEVKLVIMDNDTKEYWNGTGWTEEYTELDCDYDDEDYEWWCDDSEDLDLTYKSGHEIIVTAIATDNGGCMAEHEISFMFIDDNEPVIEFIYPEDTDYGCGEPSEIYGIAYDGECETIVTNVYIQIIDEAGKFWNGVDSWVDEETNLSCIYNSETEEWYYDGNIPEWQHDNTYDIYAFAKDAADNIGWNDLEIYYDCPVYGSISGTIYYYGEGYGNVTIWLTLAPFGDSIPIDFITIPHDEQDRPIVGKYEFTGLEDENYWVGAFMDHNDNMGVDAWEPMGFAVNKSSWPDYFVISGGNDLIDKDVTLFDPEPSIDLEKYVWDECGEWVDETVVEEGEEVKFNISIHNDGIAAPLIIEDIEDVLPDGFEYIDDSAIVTVVNPDATWSWDHNPVEDYEGNWILTWTFDELIIFPCNWIYIEFNASTSECDDLDPFENLAYVDACYPAWDCDEGYSDEDSANVWIFCECVPAMEIYKEVWCPIGLDWVTQRSVEHGETVRFNISFDNDGTGICDLSEIVIEDQMWPELTYAGQMTVDHPDTITSYTHEWSSDGQTFWLNFTGYLEPGEHIFIEFDATVDWSYYDYTYNDVYAWAYSEFMDENLEDGWESVFLLEYIGE